MKLIVEEFESIKNTHSIYSNERANTQITNRQNNWSTINFKDITYKYPGSDLESLRNINFSLKKGEMLGIIGPSGSGKTTLVDIILGLLTPTSGEIIVNGSCIKNISEFFNHKIGYVPQDIYISDDTIKHNIAFGLPDENISIERINQVIRATKLDKVISRLPDGFDTYIEGNAINLSGGEKQRIGIARALYLQPDILVFDEATSALDGETEQEILDVIDMLRDQCTIITVAHKRKTIKACDRVAYICNSKLCAEGNLDELYSIDPEFREFVKHII